MEKSGLQCETRQSGAGGCRVWGRTRSGLRNNGQIIGFLQGVFFGGLVLAFDFSLSRRVMGRTAGILRVRLVEPSGHVYGNVARSVVC